MRWPAATGLNLVEEVVKVFLTGPQDTGLPTPRNWELSLPVSGTKEPLVIYFPETMDIGLLKSGLDVIDPAENPLDGEIRIGPMEKSWLFILAAGLEALPL